MQQWDVLLLKIDSGMIQKDIKQLKNEIDSGMIQKDIKQLKNEMQKNII